MKTKLLLITPPFTQLNTPYPATAYIKGFLNTILFELFRFRFCIEVILKFSKKGLQDLFTNAKIYSSISDNSKRILALQDEYIKTIDAVIAFLQGKIQR